MDLTDPRPAFLLKLDSDRAAALSDFRRFVEELFRHAPPSNFFRVPVDDREDVISEVMLHCIDNDCAKLRKFQPREGSLFAGWLAVVASRKISDVIKSKKNVMVAASLQDEHEVDSHLPNPEEIAIKNELERVFLAGLKKLGRQCRLLMRLRIMEYKNREIVQLLRLPKDQNKTIGNRVIECRKKLIELLRGVGYFDAMKSE